MMPTKTRLAEIVREALREHLPCAVAIGEIAFTDCSELGVVDVNIVLSAAAPALPEKCCGGTAIRSECEYHR